MGFRFQRRIRIAPGLRINLSKSGLSLTAGVRGASINVGKNGVYRNLGIPGTGLSHRTRIDSARWDRADAGVGTAEPPSSLRGSGVAAYIASRRALPSSTTPTSVE
jgi:hypothetical protein